MCSCILSLLDELGRRRYANLLVEGVAAVLGSFLEVREIDEVWAFIAPKLLGGEKAPSPIAGYGVEKLCRPWPSAIGRLSKSVSTYCCGVGLTDEAT